STQRGARSDRSRLGPHRRARGGAEGLRHAVLGPGRGAAAGLRRAGPRRRPARTDDRSCCRLTRPPTAAAAHGCPARAVITEPDVVLAGAAETAIRTGSTC